MASSSITSWQMDGEKMGTVTDFIFLGSKIIVDCGRSHEIKRLLGNAMTKLDSILKSIDITLLTKVHIVNAMVFPVVTYGCESWTIKKAEHQRIDAFELWCWRRLLRVLWTARRSDQSVLKEINPEYSLKGLMLKLQYFGHLTHWKRPWCWERLKAGGEGDDRGWDVWMASLTQWTWVWANCRRQWRTGQPGVLPSTRLQSYTWHSDWITTKVKCSHKVKWKSLSRVRLFATPWTRPLNSPGQNTGVNTLSLLQGIFPTQGSNPSLLHCRWILYQLSHKGSAVIKEGP